VQDEKRGNARLIQTINSSQNTHIDTAVWIAALAPMMPVAGFSVSSYVPLGNLVGLERVGQQMLKFHKRNRLL